MNPCPNLNLNVECAGCCRQVTFCSSNVSNQLDNHTVVYNQADNEITNEPAEGFSFLGYLSSCCKGQSQQRRRETFEGVNIYFNGNFEVTIEDAAKKCNLHIQKIQDGRKRMRVSDFNLLEEAAKSLASESDSSGSDQSLPRKSFRRPRLQRQETVYEKPKNEWLDQGRPKLPP